MEENEVIHEIEHDDNCFWGYVGACIGGLVGAIPWILLYYFYSFNLVILPALIPIFAITGYKFFKGTVTKTTFRTIVIISIFIFGLTIYGLFPYCISTKNGIELKKFSKSKYYNTFSNDIIEPLSTEILSGIIGLGLAYAEISNLLNRYKSTNGMIKDSNLFIRKDNDPIDSEDYNGIIFTDKENNPVKSKIDVDKTVTETKSDNYTDYMRNKNFFNYKNVSSSRVRATNYNGARNIIKIYYFLILIVIVITFLNVFSRMKNFNNQIYRNNYISNLDMNYNFDNNFDTDYYLDEYVFEDRNIVVTIPEGWSIAGEDNTNLYLIDDENCTSVVAVIDSNNENLKDIHDNIINSLAVSPINKNSVNVKINGNDAYYYIDVVKAGDYNVFYTMEYKDYFIIFINKDVPTYRFAIWENFLKNVKEI